MVFKKSRWRALQKNHLNGWFFYVPFLGVQYLRLDHHLSMLVFSRNLTPPMATQIYYFDVATQCNVFSLALHQNTLRFQGRNYNYTLVKPKINVRFY